MRRRRVGIYFCVSVFRDRFDPPPRSGLRLCFQSVFFKCRHINYESLEAFLCVECGYCSYAHFGFRLTAAMETDFTPVANEVRRVLLGKVESLAAC